MYAPQISLEILIPAGVLFRVFGPTRDIGNALFAIGIAGYFLIPLLYAFVGVSYVAIHKQGCLIDQSMSDVIKDEVFLKGQGFLEVSALSFVSVFMPNLVAVLVSMFITGFYSYLKSVG